MAVVASGYYAKLISETEKTGTFDQKSVIRLRIVIFSFPQPSSLSSISDIEFIIENQSHYTLCYFNYYHIASLFYLIRCHKGC